jgi:hypothetical protein
MLLMIDNYDSFTYNLVQYFGELGEQVEVHRNDEISLDDIAQMRPQRIVISPGPCTPNEAGICLDLVREASVATPILGVCLGHQAVKEPLQQNRPHFPDRLKQTVPALHSPMGPGVRRRDRAMLEGMGDVDALGPEEGFGSRVGASWQLAGHTRDCARARARCRLVLDPRRRAQD